MNTLYREHYNEYTIQRHYMNTLYRYTIQNTLYRIHYTENTIQNTLYRIHYTEYTIRKNTIAHFRGTVERHNYDYFIETTQDMSRNKLL